MCVLFSVQENLGGPTSHLPGEIESLAREPYPAESADDGTLGDQEGGQPQIWDFT